MLQKMLLPVIIASVIFVVAFLVFKTISRSMEKRIGKRKKELEELFSENKTSQDHYKKEYNEIQEKYNLKLLRQNRIFKILFLIDVIISVFSGLAFIFLQKYDSTIIDVIYSTYSASAMILAFIGLRLVGDNSNNNAT